MSLFQLIAGGRLADGSEGGHGSEGNVPSQFHEASLKEAHQIK